MVALHHAFIPMPDGTADRVTHAGDGYRADGSRSTTFVNEGARVSVLLAHIMRQPVSAAQRVLLDEVSQPPPAHGGDAPARAVAIEHTRRPDGAVARLRDVPADLDHATMGRGDVVWIHGLLPVAFNGRA